MNDVLPKPFTKEGLLAMLEKHLSHLKKQPPGYDHMPAPPPPALNSAKRSLKSEDSPVTSPATASNWNSPGNLAGVSPSTSNQTDDPYMTAVQHSSAGPYPVQPMGAPQMYNTSPGGPMSAPGRQAIPQQHRRGISDISGGAGDRGADVKRQQMFAPPTPMGAPMAQPLPQQMQRPPR